MNRYLVTHKCPDYDEFLNYAEIISGNKKRRGFVFTTYTVFGPGKMRLCLDISDSEAERLNKEIPINNADLMISLAVTGSSKMALRNASAYIKYHSINGETYPSIVFEKQ